MLENVHMIMHVKENHNLMLILLHLMHISVDSNQVFWCTILINHKVSVYSTLNNILVCSKSLSALIP